MVWSRLQGYYPAQFQGNYTVIVRVNGLLCAARSLLSHTQQPCVPASPGSPLALQAPYKTEEAGLAGPQRSTAAQGHKEGASPHLIAHTQVCSLPPKPRLPGLATSVSQSDPSVLMHLFNCGGFRQVIPPRCASVSRSENGVTAVPPLRGCYED